MCYYFFSCRRRHTSLQGDWSSDVCSSDLPSSSEDIRAWPWAKPAEMQTRSMIRPRCRPLQSQPKVKEMEVSLPTRREVVRSEERRVGKECRTRSAQHKMTRNKSKEC